MRTYYRVEDARGKPCLVLEDASLLHRILYKLSKRRLCFWYEENCMVTLIHISLEKAKEVDNERY